MSIVLLTVDCLRADHLGCYGYDLPTSPNIDSFSRSGSRYVNSYSNCPGTRWAFQSLHTGLSTVRFDGLGLPEDYTSLAERFQDAGYATGGFAVNGYVSRDYNYDDGFDEYYSVRESTKEESLLTRTGKRLDRTLRSGLLREKVLVPTFRRIRRGSTDGKNRFQPRHSDSDTVTRALEFIEQQQSADRKFFCWIHFMDAHTPYGFWPEHLRAIRGDADVEHTLHPGEEGRATPEDGPDADVTDTYDACIRSVDEQVGRVLEHVTEDTTVVLTGDHGEEFGGSGDREFHDASVYGSLTQVPIIVRDESIPAGEKEAPAQHLDIPPTLLAAAAIDLPPHFEGAPLQTLDREVDAPIFFALGPDEMAVRSGEWKYVERGGETEFYRVDHMETESEPTDSQPEKEEELAGLLDRYRRTQPGDYGAGSLVTGDDELSTEVKANLEDLGYR